jgi:hypothetical protein
VNLLIIGGLFLLAIVAILGAILLSRGGEVGGSAKNNTTTTQPAGQTNLIERGAHAAANTTNRPAATAQAGFMTAPDAGTPHTPTPPTEPESSYTAAASRQAQFLLNGQFVELAREIRTLHQQAWQLEQRLSVLTEMVNQVEDSQGGYHGEGEAAHRFPSDSTSS